MTSLWASGVRRYIRLAINKQPSYRACHMVNVEEGGWGWGREEVGEVDEAYEVEPRRFRGMCWVWASSWRRVRYIRRL